MSTTNPKVQGEGKLQTTFPCTPGSMKIARRQEKNTRTTKISTDTSRIVKQQKNKLVKNRLKELFEMAKRNTNLLGKSYRHKKRARR